MTWVEEVTAVMLSCTWGRVPEKWAVPPRTNREVCEGPA